ncbi:MAG: 3-phosphoshikimate 1-carboxyvinyltransferase [Flavobacteriales bacterium]|nr:3-phosphoshikimate 1-carboxyvinyltransferase [Flavobacteriales bacterium]
MNYKISHPTKVVNCEIDLPSSKSISNRLLIIKALCKEKFLIKNLSESDDTILLKNALNSKEKTINVSHAGTSFRFLTSFLSIQKGKEFILNGSDRMKERPIKELVNSLEGLGVKIEYLEKEDFPPLKIIGTEIDGGEIEIDGTISSQFISSLLLIAPNLKNGLILKIKGELVSKPYVLMTLKLMGEFGINWTWNKDVITILKQEYVAKNYTVESDWSAATFWFQSASLSEKCKIILRGLNEESIQGDSACKKIFKDLGVDSVFKNGDLILTKNKRISPSETYNLIETPDIYQSLKCTLFTLNKDSEFTGIQTLRNKETDRIAAVENELLKLYTPKIIETYNDHRMAMSFAPLSLKFEELQISNPGVISKSYPNYWKDIKKGGFKISS